MVLGRHARKVSRVAEQCLLCSSAGTLGIQYIRAECASVAQQELLLSLSSRMCKTSVMHLTIHAQPNSESQYGHVQVPEAERTRLREVMMKRREEQDARALQEKLAASQAQQQEAAKQEAGMPWRQCCACCHRGRLTSASVWRSEPMAG